LRFGHCRTVVGTSFLFSPIVGALALWKTVVAQLVQGLMRLAPSNMLTAHRRAATRQKG
jgi:hypothetical protein